MKFIKLNNGNLINLYKCSRIKIDYSYYTLCFYFDKYMVEEEFSTLEKFEERLGEIETLLLECESVIPRLLFEMTQTISSAIR